MAKPNHRLIAIAMTGCGAFTAAVLVRLLEWPNGSGWSGAGQITCTIVGIAAGLTIAGVTVFAEFSRRPTKPPKDWTHV